jgi:prepilin-type N-terminal cleavage/methylation domain-containing protein
MTPSRRQDGFTLLELLIVIAVTSILLTTAFQTYVAIMNAQERALAENRRDSITALVLDRLESELVGTLLVKEGANVSVGSAPGNESAGEGDDASAGRSEVDRAGQTPNGDGRQGGNRDQDNDRDEPSDSGDEDEARPNPFVFIGEDGGPGERASDSIRFVTQTPARGVGALADVGLRIVSYEVRATSAERAALFRAEDFLSDGVPEPARFGDTPAVDDVYRLKIRYQAENADWLESWDSQTGENRDDLPVAVELTLQLEEQDEVGEYKTGRALTRIVALPLRPIGDEEGDEGGADCGSSQTVEQCLAQFEEQIDALAASSPESKQLLDTLRQEIGNACWNDREVANEIRSLSKLVSEAGGPNLDEECR